MGSAANQVARNGPGGQRFGVTARCNAGTGNCERIESGCKAARCTNLQCGDRRDISAPQLRGNIPSVPVLPGKGNPDGCVSYKAPARNAKTNQRMRPDAVTSAIFSHLPDEIFPRRNCAEIFRLSPYCPKSRGTVPGGSVSAQSAMRALETVKESNPAARPGAQICNAGTDEIFPRRNCAEIFRLSPYCPARAIRTAVFPTKHQPAMRRQIKECGQTRSPLRFFLTFQTRYFRVAIARKYSVCPRIAP